MVGSVPAYVGWALLALVSYSLFTPLAKLATEQAPSNVVALLANGVLVVAAAGAVAVAGDDVAPALEGRTPLLVLVAGSLLAVGILSYYRALSLGPVSVVVPIFGSFIAVASLLGVVVLGEDPTLRQVAGVVLATVGIYLAATG